MALSCHHILTVLAAVILCAVVSACSNVQVVRLTSDTFSSRAINEVEILEQEPTTDHLRLAELVASSSTSSLDNLQHDILKKAAKLGASAVVFSPPTVHTEQRIAQSGGYNPWGYYSPYYYGPGLYGPFGYGGMYGPWGPGWGYMDVPYVVQVQRLKGLAIRDTGS
jgi:hypothetical protein